MKLYDIVLWPDVDGRPTMGRVAAENSQQAAIHAITMYAKDGVSVMHIRCGGDHDFAANVRIGTEVLPAGGEKAVLEHSPPVKTDDQDRR